MPCPYPKGSREAKEFMAHLRARRGKGVCGGKKKKSGWQEQLREYLENHPGLLMKGGQLEKESLASLKKRLWKEIREHHKKYPHTKLPLEIRQIAEEIKRRTNPGADEDEPGSAWRKIQETRKAETRNPEIMREWWEKYKRGDSWLKPHT